MDRTESPALKTLISVLCVYMCDGGVWFSLLWFWG